jgi:8-oxo-dGTP pyrophosphatase MutT (NUDIX family)
MRTAIMLLCCAMSLGMSTGCARCPTQLPCYVHLDPPEQFHPKMHVAGCYCEYEGKILMLLRSPHKPQGNTWCAPGGKLESTESPEQAVIRELKEEIDLDISGLPLSYCRRVFVRFPQVDFVLDLYRVRLKEFPQLTIANEEHLDYCWVSPKEALELPLIPGGDECVEVVFGANFSSEPQPLFP